MDVKVFNTIEQCEDALLNELTHQINHSLDNQKTVSLALAGGSTPKGLYQKLSDSELAWSKLKVTLTDERWVDIHHSDSNENMLKQTLFRNHARVAQFIALKNSENTPQAGQIRTDHLLKHNVEKLDYVVLGMGEDGHFASIFPNMKNTDDLLDLAQSAFCLPANPKDKPSRMSLTLSYLLSAQQIYIFIKGALKRQLIEQESVANTSQSLPIHYLLTQTLCPVTVYWSES